MTNYLLAGGGTAGHVNPLLALADEIMSSSGNQVWALGTAEGLESKLVPERGYQLVVVPRLPMPRKINSYLFRFPALFRNCTNGFSANAFTDQPLINTGLIPANILLPKKSLLFIIYNTYFD